MKKLIIVIGLLFCVGGICNAQNKGFTFGSWSQAETVSLNGHKEFKAVDVAVSPGWAFNHSVFVRLQGELSVGMWDNGGDDKTYRTVGTLGPSFGWNIMKDNGWGIVDVVATVGNTVDSKDWKYLFYDLGFDYSFHSKDTSRYPTRWSMGLGVRYRDSHNSRFQDQCNLYVKIGFRFN